jgi:hypothetical protein
MNVYADDDNAEIAWALRAEASEFDTVAPDGVLVPPKDAADLTMLLREAAHRLDPNSEHEPVVRVPS